MFVILFIFKRNMNWEDSTFYVGMAMFFQRINGFVFLLAVSFLETCMLEGNSNVIIE